MKPWSPLCCSVDVAVLCTEHLLSSTTALLLFQQTVLLDLKSLMELGYSCAQEDLGSWLSNTAAPSVFSDTQSSLKGESNPIDKLSVLMLSGKPKTSVLLIQFA